MSYWVYENWRAHGHRATIHCADCGHCNEGLGQSGGTSAENGRWHGPFASVEHAVTAAIATGGTDRRCGSCRP